MVNRAEYGIMVTLFKWSQKLTDRPGITFDHMSSGAQWQYLV